MISVRLQCLLLTAAVGMFTASSALATEPPPAPAASVPSAEGGKSGVGDTDLPAASRPCKWWKPWGGCDATLQVEGLPADAPREGILITVDTKHNNAYLFRDGILVAKAPAATGSEKVLKKGSRTWMFHTPRGRLKVLRKVEDPIWVKPDWAFVEEGKPVPPPDSPARRVKGHLGKYALHLGDGIMIHGTEQTESLGKNASHGCIRLSDDMLEVVYQAAEVGTNVYIF